MATAMLDIQSLPSLERFDSQLLDLFRQNTNDAGVAGVHVMDELQAPDDDLALQRLMSLKNSQNKAAAAAALQQQQQQQLDGSFTDQPTSHTPDTPHVQTSNMLQTNQQQQNNLQAATAAPASTAEVAQLAAQHLMMQGAGDGYNMPSAAELMAQGRMPAALSLGLPGLDTNMLAFGSGDPFALAAAYGIPGDTESPLAGAAAAAGFMPNMAGMMAGNSGGVVGSKRRSRGSQMADLIKMEQEFADYEGLLGDGEYQPDDSRTSTQSPNKRSKAARGEAHAVHLVDSDYEDTRVAGLSITPDMDEHTRARIRREKNRVAARKCRAKKMQFMVELQKTLRELMRKNEEYRLQVITWHKMFSREVRLREAMKRIIAVMWQCGAPPAASGYTANDIIIGLESGTLDINGLVRSLAVLSSAQNINTQDLGTAAAGSTLASPTPLVLGNHAAAVAGGAVAAMPPVTPRAPPASLLHMQLSDVSTQAAADLANEKSVAAAAAAAAAGMAAGCNTVVNSCGSPVAGEQAEGMVSMSMLMGEGSHVSCSSAMAGVSPTAAAAAGAAQANAMKLAAAVAAGDAGVNGLPDMMSAGGQAAGAGGLEGTWMWGNTQGLHTASAAAVAGPSCITTGAE